jgi:hypothetical protein
MVKAHENYLTPEQFAQKMQELADAPDREIAHIDADEAMCSLLEAFGYCKGTNIFRKSETWYS